MLEPPSSSDQVNPKDIKALKEVFDLFDKDRDGSVTCQELKTVLNTLLIDTTLQETEDMISSIDVDGSGTVDFEEFLKMMSNNFGTKGMIESESEEKAEEEEMRHAFKVFDMDGNGFIDERELKTTMAKMGENLSDKDVKKMMHMADKNGDGKIDYEEFMHMMQHK